MAPKLCLDWFSVTLQPYLVLLFPALTVVVTWPSPAPRNATLCAASESSLRLFPLPG